MRQVDPNERAYGAVDPANFVLPGLMQPLAAAADGLPVRLYRVRFGAGARTHWHSHDREQILFGLSGRCVVVDRAGNELFLEPGGLVVLEPGEEHWHGAAPGGGGEHLAINTGETTTWLEASS